MFQFNFGLLSFFVYFRAYARMGNAHVKMDQLNDALHCFEKSLSEHRDPEVVKKHKQLEKEVKEKEKLAYINPEISEVEKNKGNELFKKGLYLEFLICNESWNFAKIFYPNSYYRNYP